MNDVFSENIQFPFGVSHYVSHKKSEKLLHIHDNGFEFLLFLAGEANYFLETAIYNMKRGDLLLIPPNTIHGYRINKDSDYERIPLHIQQNLLLTLSTDKTPLLKIFQNPKHHILHLNEDEINQFIFHTETIIRSEAEQDYGYDILSLAHLQLLLNIVYKSYRNIYSTEKHQDVSPPIIRNAIDYINLHLTEDITIQSVSDNLGISSSRLSHLFKEYTGSSLWNYVVIKRLILSRSLLLEGKTTTEACYASGFQDYSHFNKSFSKTFNITPGKFLKEMNLN